MSQETYKNIYIGFLVLVTSYSSVIYDVSQINYSKTQVGKKSAATAAETDCKLISGSLHRTNR